MIQFSQQSLEMFAQAGLENPQNADTALHQTPKYAETSEYIHKIFKIIEPKSPAPRIVFADFHPTPVGPLSDYTVPVRLLEHPDIGVVIAQSFYDLLEPKELVSLLINPVKIKYFWRNDYYQVISRDGFNRQESTLGLAVASGLLTARALGLIKPTPPAPLVLEPRLDQSAQHHRRTFLHTLATAAAVLLGGHIGYENGETQLQINANVAEQQADVRKYNLRSTQCEIFYDYTRPLFPSFVHTMALKKIYGSFPQYIPAKRPESGPVTYSNPWVSIKQ
jgi:hypothetical protein